MANTNHFELNKTKTTTKNHRLKLRSSDPQQLLSSANSHGREKLDNVKPFCYGYHRGVVNSEELHMPREEECLPLPETVLDLRKSLAWDSAFFTSPGVLDPDELLGTVEVGVLDNPREHVYLPSDEPEIISRIGKCNLRRSLAWDNAFLTDAGVLDPDELCIINKGLKKAETRGLPGIERLHRSVDSSSTIDSRCFSLEGLEHELFEAARKSRQKGKVSNVTSSRCRKGIASKKLNVSSHSRMMSPMTASNKQSVNLHGPARSTKEASHPRGLGAQQTALSVEFNPSALKPPKIVQRVNSIPVAPSKRATLSSKHVQVEDSSTKDATGQHVIVSKKQCLRNPLNVISIPAPLPKTPRLGSSTPKKEFVDCGVRAALDATAKSPLGSLRRNPHCRSVVNGSTLSSPTRYPPRNKPDSSNSSQYSCLLPLPKSSSSALLASPVDVWESSSPTLKSQKSSICQKNLSTSYSSLEFFPVSDATQTSDMGGLPQLQTSPDLTDISRKLRPSGLRKPSPKLGYFYGMSSLSPTGVLQYQWDMNDTTLRDATRSCNLDRDADSVKHTKLPTARTSMGTGRTKTGVLSPLSVRARNHNQSAEVGTAEHGQKVKTRGTERVLKSKVQREEKEQICGGTRKQHIKRHAESNLQKPNLREKENLFSFEDHVNSLSNHIGAFDLGAM